MRLAIISTIFHYPWGGPDKRWTALAEACQARGDAVFLGIASLTADHPRVKALVDKGATLWLRPNRSAYLGKVDQWKRSIPFVREKFLEAQLGRFKPDVVFVLQGGAYDCFQEYHLLRWCRAKQVPYILNCSLNRRGATFGPQTIDSFARDFREASKVLFMSTENLRITEELFREQLGNAVVIQNPLDLEISTEEVGPALPGPRPRLGFVGRIDIHHKGLDLLLEAMARVRPEFDVELHLTGRSEKSEEFAALVERHGLTDRVFVHDHAGREGLIKAYKDAELMVLPSRWEGCASVMLEAMMAGRPELVTPVGGVADWLTDNVDAFIAEDVSVDAIERALRRALQRRDRWSDMGQAARAAFTRKRDNNPVTTLVGLVDEVTQAMRHTALGERLENGEHEAMKDSTTLDLSRYASGLRLGDSGIWYASAQEAVSYPSEGNDQCFEIEDKSFWFRHRNACIVELVKKFPPRGNGPIFDVGGGNGFVAKGLMNAGWDVVLVEPGPAGARNAKARGLQNIVCATTQAARFNPGSMPAIGAFDVVEHIEDDVKFLKHLYNVLEPGGMLYLTVPAYNFLWSEADISAGHYRRYMMRDLEETLHAAGFQVAFDTYFFRVLPLTVFLFRSLPFRFGLRSAAAEPKNAKRTHGTNEGIMVRTMRQMLAPEANSIARGERMAFGGSCLVAARKLLNGN